MQALIYTILLNKFILGYLIKKKNYFFFTKYFFLVPIVISLKYNSIFKCLSLMDICVIDNINNFPRFELIYSFLFRTFRIYLKFKVSAKNYVLSISFLFKSAPWLEREAWDMFGIKFLLHNDLRRILTDYGFCGHPLRKDFPLTGYFELNYDDNMQAINIGFLELSQQFRLFKFYNPWIKWKI